MAALDTDADQVFAEDPSHHHASFTIAAPSTRFTEDTEELLARHFGAEAAAAIPRPNGPLIGNASVLSGARATAALGWHPRCWTTGEKGSPQSKSYSTHAFGRHHQQNRHPHHHHCQQRRQQQQQQQRQRMSTCAAGTCAADGMDGSSAARAALMDPGLKTYNITGHVLDSGEVLPNFAELTYVVHGEEHIQEGGSGKVILHPTSFDATHPDLGYQIGPGATLDTDKYAVIIPNLLGNGVSYSPSRVMEGGPPYPSVVTVDDNVRLQQRLLTDALGLDLESSPLELVYGYSMGGMQALAWARLFPTELKSAAAVCGAAVCSDYNDVFLGSLDATLTASDGTAESTAAHLKAFARIYAGWGVGSPFYQGKVWATLGFDSLDDFVVRSYEGGFAAGDPRDLLAQVDTWRAASSTPRGGRNAAAGGGSSDGGGGGAWNTATIEDGLKGVNATCLLMPCSTDRYFPVDEIKAREASLIPNAILAPIESGWG